MTTGTHTVIVIGGPTASGKTGVAIRLAKALDTQIISADSRQCFRELNIGVAKPSPQQLSEVHHYFINSHTIREEMNAAVFEQYALASAEAIFTRNPVAVMVGGTGMYIRAFCEGLDPLPATPPEVRAQVMQSYAEWGLPWLQQEVARLDPLFWAKAERANPQRLMRALEFRLHTGSSIEAFRTRKKAARPFRIVKLALDVPREQLYLQINQRVEDMFQQGLVEEVASLSGYRSLNALQTVGYTEVFRYLDGLVSLEKALHDVQINTRHYAKRQLTWFKKEADLQWISPDLDNESLLRLCELG